MQVLKRAGLRFVAVAMVSFALLLNPVVAFAADPNFGELHVQYYFGDPPVTYWYRNGYAGYDYSFGESWMWVKPADRSVGAGACWAQAVIDAGGTLNGSGEQYLLKYGPWVINNAPLAAGEAVESYVYFNQPFWFDCLGYGKLRHPVTLTMHPVYTERNRP